mmetsp:Transcript_44390/g.100137  ORF Transcript_44390/g.100137 Transcript_44390/m.100137 type:complete len:256 (-) Transcript_44390:82-849(-)
MSSRRNMNPMSSSSMPKNGSHTTCTWPRARGHSAVSRLMYAKCWRNIASTKTTSRTLPPSQLLRNSAIVSTVRTTAECGTSEGNVTISNTTCDCCKPHLTQKSSESVSGEHCGITTSWLFTLCETTSATRRRVFVPKSRPSMEILSSSTPTLSASNTVDMWDFTACEYKRLVKSRTDLTAGATSALSASSTVRKNAARLRGCNNSSSRNMIGNRTWHERTGSVLPSIGFHAPRLAEVKHSAARCCSSWAMATWRW